MFHTVKLSKSDPTPIYIQLASELAKLIQADVLYAGMKLPTIRLLSKQLSINRDTVVSAYKLLEQQGLVESHIGKGTYIAPKRTNNSNANIVTTSTKPNFCCSNLVFSSNFYPTSLCHEISTKIIDKEGWEAFTDPLYRARHSLKQNIAAFLQNKLHIDAYFAQVKVITSYEDFLLNLFKIFPKVGICCEELRDLSSSCYLRSIGAKISEIPLTTEGLDLDILEKYLKSGTISYIFVSPILQNPTGLCYSEENKHKLLELATKYDAYIIEDGTYSDFAPKTPSLYSMCTDARVIYLYHFSKIYLPYMKYSFALLPSGIMKRCPEEIDCSFNERFLHYYLESEDLNKIYTSIHSECAKRYNKLLEVVYKYKDYVTIENTKPGLWIWAKINGIGTDKFYTLLTENSIIVSPSKLFSLANQDGYFRISISEISLNAIEELDDKLNKALTT